MYEYLLVIPVDESDDTIAAIVEFPHPLDSGSLIVIEEKEYYTNDIKVVLRGALDTPRPGYEYAQSVVILSRAYWPNHD